MTFPLVESTKKTAKGLFRRQNKQQQAYRNGGKAQGSLVTTRRHWNAVEKGA